MGWIKLKELPEQKVDSKDYDLNYWKIEEGYVWHQGRKLRKVDPDTFEVRKDSSQIFIARDKDHVFYAWSLQKRIDRNSFEEVANGYWTDCNFAYFEYEASLKPLKDGDVESFSYVGGPYARDSKFAYYGGRALKNCQYPLQFRMMVENNDWYAGDGSTIYFDGAEIKGADFETWRKLDGGYSCDKDSIYFGSKKLPRVDIDSWKILAKTYSSDKVNVYHMHFKLKGADPGTWQYLESNYSKDRHTVYYLGRPIEGADPESFRVTGDRSGTDKHQSYNGGQICT